MASKKTLLADALHPDIWKSEADFQPIGFASRGTLLNALADHVGAGRAESKLIRTGPSGRNVRHWRKLA